jgi:hypothetical protein
MVERPRALTVRISEEELVMLQELAEHEGVSASDYIRLHLRRDHKAAFGDRKPEAKPKRK